MNNPADKLIPRHFATRSAIAEHFGVTTEAVRLWFRDGIPPGNALAMQRITKGEVTAMEILKFAEKAKAQRVAA